MSATMGSADVPAAIGGHGGVDNGTSQAATATAVPQSDAPLDAQRAQQIADTFVAAVNGDLSSQEDWIGRFVSSGGLEKRSRAEWSGILTGISDASGGLRLREIGQRGRWLDLRVEVGVEGRLREISLRRDRSAPDRIVDVWAIQWPINYSPPSDGWPTTVQGLSTEIRRRIEFAASHDDFSGVALIVHNRQPIYNGAFGYADRQANRLIDIDTPFILASAGKMFTTVAIGQLAETGRLSLDSHLGDLLPDYPNQDARQITVGQLLAHTAGLGGFFDRPGAIGATFSSAAEALPLFASQPLLFRPGSAARYSNEGFIVLGAIVERVTGMTYYDYIAENVFGPSGMTHTGFAAAPNPVPLPTGYVFADDDLLGLGRRYPVSRAPLSHGYSGGPAGGAYSTAGDMSAFMTALTEGQLLRRSTLAKLLETQPLSEEGHTLGFQSRTLNGRTLFGHNGGSTAGAEVNVFAVLETGDHYVLMSNYAPPVGQPLSDDAAAMLATVVEE